MADGFSAGAIELDFSPQRAKVLAQQDLVDYFAGDTNGGAHAAF